MMRLLHSTCTLCLIRNHWSIKNAPADALYTLEDKQKKVPFKDTDKLRRLVTQPPLFLFQSEPGSRCHLTNSIVTCMYDVPCCHQFSTTFALPPVRGSELLQRKPTPRITEEQANSD